MSRLTVSPIFREVLLYSIPALVIGLVLRIALTVRMPWGFVQYDSCEYLETPFHLLTNLSFFVDGKRGFLVPILFTVPFLLHIPALIAIPVGQHFLGLVATLFSGAITRFWFRCWRWFILPVTLFVAVNPSMLWYEQSIMGESEYLFALLFLALTGTLWALRPSRARFGILLAAFICAAGARPEGKLFLVFGLALGLLVLWRQWRTFLKCSAAMLAVMVASSLIVRQSTAPQLLYASLIQLAPDHSRLLPGVEPYIIPLRDKVRAESGGDPQQLVKVSKRIRDVIDSYVRLNAPVSDMYYKVLGRTLRDLCIDAILAHPLDAMEIPFEKFRLAVDSWSAYRFTDQALLTYQIDAYLSDKWMYESLGRQLTGSPRDEAGIRQFVTEHYSSRSVAWLGKLQMVWNQSIIWWRTPDQPARIHRWVHDFAGGVPGGMDVLPGIPFFYILSLVGMLFAMVWPHPSRRVHLAWVPVMLAVWFAATLIGVTNARYRFAYEPFCFIYLCLLADCLFRLCLPARKETVN